MSLERINLTYGIICNQEISEISFSMFLQSRLAETPADPESCAVYLAYSVTLLHHGCVLHTVVPGVPWGHAHSALPTYSLFGGKFHRWIIFTKVPLILTK